MKSQNPEDVSENLPEPLSRTQIRRLSKGDRAIYEADMRKRKALRRLRRRIDPTPKQGPGAGMSLVID